MPRKPDIANNSQESATPPLTDEEARRRIATPTSDQSIVTGIINFAMQTNLSPDEAAGILVIDPQTANDLAFGLSGVADGQIVTETARSLQPQKKKGKGKK